MAHKILDTVQDVEAAFGLPPSSGATPAPTPQASPTPAPPVAATTGDAAFVFIGERPQKTIEFLYPFSFAGKEYRSYTLRRLNAEQVAEVGQELRRTGEMATLYSALTGIPFVACRLMDADDAEAMAAAATDFMPAGLRQILQ